jgi:hypothetical protein
MAKDFSGTRGKDDGAKVPMDENRRSAGNTAGKEANKGTAADVEVSADGRRRWLHKDVSVA